MRSEEENSIRGRFVTFLKYLCAWVVLAPVINVIYEDCYPIIQPYTNYNLLHPVDDHRTMYACLCVSALCCFFHRQIWWLIVSTLRESLIFAARLVAQIGTMVPHGIRREIRRVLQTLRHHWTQWELLWNPVWNLFILLGVFLWPLFLWGVWDGHLNWTPAALDLFLRKLCIAASIIVIIRIVVAVVVKVSSSLGRLRESKRAAAAEAAAADLFEDNARPGLRRRAHRGRRRGRACGTVVDEPSATESKPEAPVAPESKAEEPSAAPEAKREEEESPAATGPPPGKKILVDDDILDDAAAHARTLETSLTAHQAEVRRLKKILKEQQREIPDAYLCPITMDPMEDPCIAADGHSYERRAITDWFARGNNTSPKTGGRLPHTHLTPNHNLKSAIRDFLEEVRSFDAATAGARD